MIRPMLLAAAAAALAAFGAFAQSASEFGRASSGEISVIAKQSHNRSGSLGITFGDGAQRYDLMAGGELLHDRVWFFGSASRNQLSGAKVDAQPIDWNHITASFVRREETPLSLPATFLTLHSTTMLSPNAMMSISVSKQDGQ